MPGAASGSGGGGILFGRPSGSTDHAMRGEPGTSVHPPSCRSTTGPRRHSNPIQVGGATCIKIPTPTAGLHAGCWSISVLRAEASARSSLVSPTHPGAWHITSHRGRRWCVLLARSRPATRSPIVGREQAAIGRTASRWCAAPSSDRGIVPPGRGLDLPVLVRLYADWTTTTPSNDFSASSGTRLSNCP